jgi:N-acetylglucosaminyldiphosphoundecaprenol N-acetyl-beta-D-mannosaminyltransferase
MSRGRVPQLSQTSSVTAAARARVCVGDTWFDDVTMAEALARIEALVRARRPAYVVTPNVDHVVRCRRDPEYADIVRAADLVLVDGQPLVWLARLAGRRLRERVAGSDLFPRLCAHAAAAGLRVFFMGGEPGVADEARRVLSARYPGLQVVGTHCPPMGFERDPAANAAAVAAVRAARPDIVFVGLGSPKQERWIVAHQAEYGPAVSLGVGISFSFVTGHVRRAPRWMQRCGLEWFHRLCMEPRRLWRRYLVNGWGFLPLVLRDVWRGRVTGRCAG